MFQFLEDKNENDFALKQHTALITLFPLPPQKEYSQRGWGGWGVYDCRWIVTSWATLKITGN